MTTTHTHGLLNSSPQRGKPGSCYLAQIFDADDKSVATIDATQDETEGAERARRLVACWNACDGIDTDMLEGFSPRFLATYPDRVLAERRALEAQRNDLLKALTEALEEDTHGLAHLLGTGWIEKARAAIAKAGVPT